MPIFDFLILGGLFSGVKKNSKNFGNKKNIGLFSKILRKWTLFVQKCRNFCNFMSLWPCLEWKTFLDGIKVNIYAYANKIVENNDILNDF